MKILLIILACVTASWAGTFTVTIPSSDDPRIAEAYGASLGLRDASKQPRPATQAEIEAALKQWLIDSTKDYERRKYTPPQFGTESTAAAQAKAPAAAPTATPKKKK